MKSLSTQWASVDEKGRLIVPDEVSTQFGLQPGAHLRIEMIDNHIRLHRPVTHLAKVYVEPTNRCNLNCRTCIRNNWEVEFGDMSIETFNRIMEDIKNLNPPPLIFFGGLGEPLEHPHILDMVGEAKSIGARVELITNGIKLDIELSRELIKIGLDMLWISIDGASPESYADVRLRATLPDVIDNVIGFKRSRPYKHNTKPDIGIVFVAMKRNIDDLPEILKLGRRLDADRVMVSNILPYTPEMCDETLYERALNDVTYLPSFWVRQLNLPKMEISDLTREPYLKALNSGYNVTLAGNNLGGANDTCTFIESGSVSIGWDGSVSPCPPLMYNHIDYLQRQRRYSHRHVIGNVNEKDLIELWNDPDYVAYRDRVHRFAFAPCTFCGGCDLSETNEADCIGNEFPACGGCLWTQGVITCP
jgi:MoaA/NifB/PqqE/SkfB family radical SAM enzyme